MTKYRDRSTGGCNIAPIKPENTLSSDVLALSIPSFNAFIGALLEFSNLSTLHSLASLFQVLLSTPSTRCDDDCKTLSLAWPKVWCHTSISFVFVTCDCSERAYATASFCPALVSSQYIFAASKPLWITSTLHHVVSFESSSIRSRNPRFLAWDIGRRKAVHDV